MCDAGMQRARESEGKSKIKNNIIYSLLLWLYIHIFLEEYPNIKFCESYVVKANILNQRTYFPLDLNNFSNYLHFYMCMLVKLLCFML